MITGEETALEMTIRQQFAAIAMQGAMANPTFVPNNEGVRYAASISILAADVLIDELNKKK